jgi:hypothetical protein
VRNPIETRVVALATVSHDPSQVLEQAVVPRHHLFADLVLTFDGDVAELWGPMRTWLACRRVVIEVVSASLSELMFTKYVAESLLFGVQGRRPRSTRLLIICHRKPVALLRTLGVQARAGPVDGIWDIPLPSRGECRILVPDLLPDAPGNAVLRLFFAATEPGEVIRRFQAFEEDPIIPPSVKDAIRWSIDMQQIPTTELERSLGYAEGHRRALERGRTEGRSEGRNEGRIEGRNEGRVEGRIEGRIEGRNEGRVEGRFEGRIEGLRALALDLLGSDRVAGLDAINDPDELRAEIRRRVAGADNAGDRR